jgi:hypothetical protein
MTGYPNASKQDAPATWVAIDIAKIPRSFWPRARQAAGSSGWHIRRGTSSGYWAFCVHRLVVAGFEVVLVSSRACCRYREARYTSWDKNDPKDAQVILELLRQGSRCATWIR